MNRSVLAAALAVALLGGCAATGTTSGESELIERVRQELATDPLLNSSQLTFAERDGTLVIGGFADSVEDMDAIREIVEGVDGVLAIENNVIVQTDS